MLIFVESNLNNIARELKSRGYQTTSNSQENPDVYLYYENIADMRARRPSIQNRLINEVAYQAGNNLNNIATEVFGNFRPTTNGTLLINTYNKSVDEIIHIIEKRVYSSLF